MPSPKEKPKGAKSKKSAGKAAARSQPAISAKQAAKLLKDKYVQQLDQRQPESGSAEVQAVDQVEGAGSWAVDELLTHERPRSDRQPDKRIKEQPRDVPEAAGPADAPASAPEGESPPPRQTNASPRQRAGPSPERAAQVKGQRPPAAPAEHPAPAATVAPADAPARTIRIKERPAVRLKEQRAGTAAPSIKEKPSSLCNQSIPSIKSIQSIPSSKERPTRPAAGRSAAHSASQPGVRPNTTQPRREAQRQMLNKSRHSFSRQPGGPGPRKAPGTAPFNHSADRTVLPRKRTASRGSAPKIRGAVYRKGVSGPKAARVPIKSAVSRPVRGIRQSAQRRMTQRAVQQAGKAAKTSAVVLKKAAVAVTKAASTLVSALAGIIGGGILLLALVVVVVIAAIANSPFGLFFAQEPNAPDTVSVAQAVGTVNMAYNSRLELLQAGDYDTITLDGQAPDWADVRGVLDALPDDLDPARREAVQTALQLVGKVNYFWGGKSWAIGWDSRWGQLTKVWAAGSSSTGTYRPFGLDCSGFVDWIFNNSQGYIIGHGGGAIMQHRYCTNITQAEARPGDLAFYPDDSHVGIVVGRNEAGKLLVCHCSSGQNNVVVTEFTASGFTVVGRPGIYST